jgi:hypothetical protein
MCSARRRLDRDFVVRRKLVAEIGAQQNVGKIGEIAGRDLPNAPAALRHIRPTGASTGVLYGARAYTPATASPRAGATSATPKQCGRALAMSGHRRPG